jgi:DNA-binding NtrC family response regulator
MQSHYEFAIAGANLAAKALSRAWRTQRLALDLRETRHSLATADELLGKSEAMAALRGEIPRLAKAACVLLRGERGAGKRHVAHLLHQAGPRRDRPLFVYRPSGDQADAASLMESLRQADLCTLYVEEIGRMNAAEQETLLAVCERRPILGERGAAHEYHVTVIAGTALDLRQSVRGEKFSAELERQLRDDSCYLPPLRERPADIELLAEHFLQRLAAPRAQGALRLSAHAQQVLREHDWPGNALELRNVIELAVVMAAGEEISADDLHIAQGSASSDWELLNLEEWERRLILAALRRSSGKVPEAAQLLGLSRASLYRKIEEYGIPRSV